MINIIAIILIFLLGFCFGVLYEIKNTFKLLKVMEKQNDEWALLCTKQNDEWVGYCKSLIDEINNLK